MTRISLVTLLVTLLLAPAASAATGGPTSLAIIGDTPYGDSQIANFPRDIEAINADPKVRWVVHLGDIKNGSSRCDDSYFDLIRSDFDRFADPLVYTPGDNEWTDCHRANNGGYLPTERLARIRSLFFDRPGWTLGKAKPVDAAEGAPFVENVIWSLSQTMLATLHVVGSNNDLQPWFGAAETAEQRALREHENAERTAAVLAWIDEAFFRAEHEDANAVVLAMQADMWDGTAADQTGFAAIKDRIAQRAGAFGRPVLLLEGDSHSFKVDHPFPTASNVTRLVVQGSTSEPHEWLRLQIDPRDPAVFSWENVPFGS